MIVYAVFAAAVIALRLFFRWKARGTRVAIRGRSWSDTALIVAAFGAMCVLPLLSLFTSTLHFADFTVSPMLFWAGTVLLLVAFWLAWRAHHDLGLNWSVHVQAREGHTLITSGIYSRIRHPMYAALFVSAVGLTPVLHNWVISAAMAGVAALFLTVRVRREERFLLGRFGDAYRDYMDRTGRALPKLRQTPARWPRVTGAYVVVDPAAPIAVTTLGSIALAQSIALAAPPGLCIVGKVETENIGIEKIVRNVITNPAIRSLVCAGVETPRHLPGATLLALHKHGTDATQRVVGSPGVRPVLPNTTRAEIDRFRAQIEIVDMVGCTDVAKIAVVVEELAHSYRDVAPSQSRPLAAAAVPRVAASAPLPDRIKLDRAGYFVITVDGRTIQLEHYDYREHLLHLTEGRDARTLYWTLISNGWVTKLDHAAYLGKELARAEQCAVSGTEFEQDGA